MRSKLFSILGNSYKVISNYIPKKEITIRLGKKFEKETSRKEFTTSAREPREKNHADEYTNPDHVALLSEKTKFLNKLFEQRLFQVIVILVFRDRELISEDTKTAQVKLSLSVHL